MLILTNEQIQQQQAIDTISDLFTNDGHTVATLEALGIQPTSRAARLAATAALSVLLAHNYGQEVAADETADTPPRNGHRPNAGAAGDRKKRTFTCRHCEEKFKTRKELNAHKTETHPAAS